MVIHQYVKPVIGRSIKFAKKNWTPITIDLLLCVISLRLCIIQLLIDTIKLIDEGEMVLK